MNIIKLNAIDSTSLFLKDLAKKTELENFTVVVAEQQFAGKGQMNTVWSSEKGKNLLFTVYVDLKGLPVNLIPYINFLTATKIREVIVEVIDNKYKTKVKWPNDIMSYNDKICGVLVENVIKLKQVEACFIGVGLNVNQLIFPKNLSKVNSLARLKGEELDKDIVLNKIIIEFKKVLKLDFIIKNLDFIKTEYLQHLYRINVPSMFKDKEGCVFMGKIINVTNQGLLVLEKEDDLLYEYAVKEIKCL